MKTSACGLCAVTVMAMCLCLPSTVMAADVWRMPLEPVDENDDAGGNVVVVYKPPADSPSTTPGESHVVVVAHSLLPNTEHLVVVVSPPIDIFEAIVTTNNVGVLTLQDITPGDVTGGIAYIKEPDGAGGWITRLVSP
jgi:hypothetical protein